ncbi:MAG: extracellular solute-binding protein [Chloroflexota bacterium]|nr:extracellular solute-binding protein [Chloroflexota bacterium]
MMNQRTSKQSQWPPLSRRAVVGLAAGAPLSSMLRSGSSGALAQGQASPEAAEAPQFNFPDTGIQLPTDDITFRWLNSGPGPKGVFLNMLFASYQQAHPNVTVLYEQLPWNEIGQIVPLGVRNGNAHDVFQLPATVPSAQAVSEGWVTPLDDIIPDFAEWKAHFPPGSFLNGFTDFDGKTYTFPAGSNRRYSTLLLYHQGYMQQAGYDPANAPLAWDEFRAAARKITEQGAGEYYGLILEGNQTDRFEEFVGNLARMAGASADPQQIDWRTGMYVHASEQHIAAAELLLAIRDDGSVFPGSASLNAHDARARMTQAVAGMILQGPWNIPTWQSEAPDFDFGVASQPVPDNASPLPLTVGPGGGNYFWVFAESPYANVAGDVFHYLGTDEGQRNWANVVGIADPPVSPEALASAELDPRSQAAAKLFSDQLRLGPDPRVRNPDAAKVYTEMRAITPNFGETLQGLFAGAIDNVKDALQDVQDRSEAELERAIAAAQEKGAQVSRDDFVFPNWDPSRDYTEQDYQAL